MIFSSFLLGFCLIHPLIKIKVNYEILYPMHKNNAAQIWAKLFVYFIVPLVFISCTAKPSVDFPGSQWDRVPSPESLGYCADRLREAQKYTQDIHTSAVVIVVNGVILHKWGEVEKKFMTHSIRKSFLSALFGPFVEDGTIDLGSTIADIGIDDDPPLTDLEKTATIRDCIKSRSGIYHDALYETQTMKDLKPTGLEVKPGTFWYYNNWDFNALGTIFEELTGQGIFEAIDEVLAKPIGMEHFKVSDGWYVTGDESIHPAYPFNISSLDLARFGLLMLRGGNWAGQQIIPDWWVEKSTRYHSDATLYNRDGYGYMWWVVRHYNKYPHLRNTCLPEGAYSAQGARGHYLLIIPEYDMVIVHRVNTFEPGTRVNSEEFGILVQMILDARLEH